MMGEELMQLESILKALEAGWLASTLGFLGILVGILSPLYFYRASRVGAQLSCQSRAIRLLGYSDVGLPKEVEIRFKQQVINRLTKVYTVFWNSGRAVTNGADIVTDDPIRCEYSEQAEVLEARVIKTTRKTNKFSIERDPRFPNKVVISFDYLNPG